MSYLTEQEWSMGNGQCPECCGIGVGFHMQDHSSRIGHKKGCKLAKQLKEIGGKPMMIGDFDPGYEFESYWSESGFLSNRLKCYPPPPPTSRDIEWGKSIEDIFIEALGKLDSAIKGET